LLAEALQLGEFLGQILSLAPGGLHGTDRSPDFEFFLLHGGFLAHLPSDTRQLRGWFQQHKQQGAGPPEGDRKNPTAPTAQLKS
jgi:hypothetical protein